MTPTDKAAFLTAMQLLTQQVVAMQRRLLPPVPGREFVLPAPGAARCGNCGATTSQACNGNGCFYLESGNGEPQA